jgi:S1-C subfamily serine protease
MKATLPMMFFILFIGSSLSDRLTFWSRKSFAGKLALFRQTRLNTFSANSDSRSVKNHPLIEARIIFAAKSHRCDAVLIRREKDHREAGRQAVIEARLAGKDSPTDVAVLKIEVKETLPTIRLGDSDSLEVGEWVMAVGNPFGLDNSVSSGIVSGKGRYIGEAYDRLIQTDAPLNPASSGGPLINLNGQVVGINKAIVSETGGSVGISFATPISLIKEILPQLESQGNVTRAWAGISI